MKNLSKDPKLAISIFNNAKLRTVSTFDFKRCGIDYPPQTISRLRAKGAIISVVKKATYDDKGVLRQSIAHYCHEGWVV